MNEQMIELMNQQVILPSYSESHLSVITYIIRGQGRAHILNSQSIWSALLKNVPPIFTNTYLGTGVYQRTSERLSVSEVRSDKFEELEGSIEI